MRSSTCGMIEGLSAKFSKQETLEVFRRICLTRSFEWNVKRAFDAKLIKCPIYLSIGQEAIAAALSVAFPQTRVFVQHRCHDFYLAYGGSVTALMDELLHLPSGCAKGMGGSASLHSPETGLFGHDGLIGSQVPIAVGYAIGSDNAALAVMGDASAEEDYVLASLGYGATKKAPVLFLCSDNNLSILTKIEVRRSWNMPDVASAFGLPSVEITDDPWLIMHHVNQLKHQLPAFLNVHYTRILWHAGTGVDGEPEWDRFALIKEELKKLGLQKEADIVEDSIGNFVDGLWQTRLKEVGYEADGS